MMINCCYGCVPPKRTTTCKFDGTCNKYAEAKKKHDQEKAEQEKEHRISFAIYQERGKKVYKALKSYRGSKWREK